MHHHNNTLNLTVENAVSAVILLIQSEETERHVYIPTQPGLICSIKKIAVAVVKFEIQV